MRMSESIAQLMTANVGVLRTADSMRSATGNRCRARASGDKETAHTAAWETTNIAMVALVLTQAARLRRDSWIALARGLPRRRRRALASPHRDRRTPIRPLVSSVRKVPR